MKAKEINDIMSKETLKVKPNTLLICCYCGNDFKYKNGYDVSFCSENCCIEQECLNEIEGRV